MITNKCVLLDKLYISDDHKALSAEEMMTLTLDYVSPRKNNVELAKCLLEKFGSFSNVLTTDWFVLKEVKGMTEHSAKALSLIYNVFQYYVESGLNKKYILNNPNSIADFFEELLRFKQVEETFIVGVDSKGKIKNKQKLAVGGIKSVGISTHAIARFITLYKPAKCYLCHNHPNGSAKPSVADIEGNNLVASLCAKMKSDLIDHIIVGADGVFSINSNKFFRLFNQN